MARAQSKVNGLIINYNQFTHTAVKLGQGKFAEVTRNPIPSEHFQADYEEDEGNQEETHDIPEVKPPKSGKGKKALPKAPEPTEIPEAEEAEQPEEL